MDNTIGLSYFTAVFGENDLPAISQFLAAFGIVSHRVQAMFSVSPGKIFVCVSAKCTMADLEEIKKRMGGTTVRVDGSVPSPFFSPKPPDEGI